VEPLGDIALAHDYLTQRGGAERVVLSLARAFPDAPIHTSFYSAKGTFPEFAGANVRPLPVNVLAPLRRHHRLALPLLAGAFSRLQISADATICSSSGWAHGARVDGRKIVYCYSPARWLYQTERYLPQSAKFRKFAVATLRRPLERWDRKAALTAHRYLTLSTQVARHIKDVYGFEAEVVHPPVTTDVNAPQMPVTGVEPGYFLCVSRLLSYKNVDAVVAAFARLPHERLLVVGEGPDKRRLQRLAGPNVRFVGSVGDAELRWLYRHALGLVTASYEDFGLTPLEAAAFGKPTAALRFGGFLDTIKEGMTGLYIERPESAAIAAALKRLRVETWSEEELRRHAASFSEERFIGRIRAVVIDEIRAGRNGASA